VRGRLRGRGPTPVGGGMLLVLVAAVAVLIAGPQGDRTPAIVVLVVMALLLVVRPGGTREAVSRSLGEDREGLDPRRREPRPDAGEEAGRDPAPAGEGERRPGRD
jgi:hypothetical protein